MHRLAIFGFLVTLASQALAQVSANPRAAAGAMILKDSAFSRVRDLDFGTLVRSSLSANRTITLARSGVLTCAQEIVCTGATQTARFRIKGPFNLAAIVRAQGSQLTNGSATVAFTPDAPALVVQTDLTGNGTTFDVGGQIVLTPQTPDGSYSGPVEVTVEFL